MAEQTCDKILYMSFLQYFISYISIVNGTMIFFKDYAAISEILNFEEKRCG